MGGLCIGSIGLPRLRSRVETCTRCAFTRIWNSASHSSQSSFSFAFPLLDRIYFAGAVHGMPGMLMRALISAICPASANNFDGRVASRHRRAGSNPRRAEFPGGACSTAETQSAPFSAACSRDFICCAFTTWPLATFVAAAINVVVAADQFSAWSASLPCTRASEIQCRSTPHPQLRRPRSFHENFAAQRQRDAESRWTIYVTIAHFRRVRSRRRSCLDAPAWA